MEWCFRAKKIFSKIDCELLFSANLTKHIDLLWWTKKVCFSSSKHVLSSFDWESVQTLHVWATTPDWPLWPKSSIKKEDLICPNPFFNLWKLKFIIGQFGSIGWSIFLCFWVRYKVFSVYCTLSQTENLSVNKEYFRLKWDLLWQKKTILKFYWNSSLIQYSFGIWVF